MSEKLKGKRIEGAVLESIMRDVLDGMSGFTHDSCIDSESNDMEIISVERPRHPPRRRATVIPFPIRNTDK